MLKRYDAIEDEMVELTQDYFDMLQHQFTKAIFYFSKNCPEDYAKFIESYKSEFKDRFPNA